MDWLLCHSNPLVPASVVYFAGTFQGVDTELGGRVLVPTVSLFREEAATYDEAAAHLLAAILTTFGPATAVAKQWEAMPAQIHVPSPYQPQVKGPDERHRGATTKDVAAVPAYPCRAASLEAARAVQREMIAKLVFEARVNLNRKSTAE